MFNCFTPRRVVVGVDVGTGSARAGVFDATYGARLATASAAIRTWTYGEGDFVEQSGDDIWRAVCLSVREAVSKAGCPAEAVVGVGFDATCSLVVVDGAGAAVSVADEPVVAGDDVRNVVVWMDHRATAEAAAITASGHGALQCVGGVISPEMEMPKIAWLKRHKPECVAPGCRLFDLADYLSWRASGDGTRSTCTAVWKSTAGLGGPHQTSELSISIKSKSIRLIFGRIDCSCRVLEARPKSLVQTVRLRAH
jgi:ribulose kinase